ncbi:MAG: CDP-diacylglycerol--glycerol-3-phosphate 3-phosphatidyltransferase [Syntrophaceae bacterium]|nr:CDP-diacylglycerol--glycerol-3-phosphate 3-phosphatidyltransferase [Syntrophaceae bacterium]
MTIPNFLTVLRIVLVPVIVILLIQGHYVKALVFFVIAGVTDCLDGLLARVLNQQTVVGAYLDPVADKALVISMFATLAIVGVIPGWLAVVVISRDCIILGGILVLTLMSVSLEIKPSFISKINTMLQLCTVFFALLLKAGDGGQYFREAFAILCWLTALFTVISGGDYIIRGMRLIGAGGANQGKT